MSAVVKPNVLMPRHTEGPWEYVPSNEHHGPYICSPLGSTIADFYVMSQPSLPSTANGGPSKPLPFLHEMADPNARLAAQAPALLHQLKNLTMTLNVCRLIMDATMRADVGTILTAAEKVVSDAIGERWTCGRGDAPKEARP